ncbi:murein transglycosylase domain-containing protein [Oceanobacter mangrovi]|uniref:murein transglycosylase domain-containing protein n=1 Tax=Oceanobacter mangrovi TaxID=2862510 RepID=UPI001C8E0745|nr:murein transglycosylase domain-containing protein [Oceanobacter mangrovi]
MTLNFPAVWQLRGLLLVVGLWLPGWSARATPELPDDFVNLSSDVQSVILEFMFFPEQANQVWGQDLQVSSVYSLVKYLDDFHTQVRIDFDQGLIRIESRGSKTPIQSMRHAVEATLLTPANPSDVDLYTAADFGLTGKPFLAGKVVDQDGKPVEYAWRAQRYADYLLAHRLQQSGDRYWLTIPMVRQFKQVSARQYGSYVNAAANRYGVDPSLILAVIETESSFNPFAVSPVGAYGLMQVMQRTAGKDVYEKIYQQSGHPSRDELFRPERNIDIGTAYLSILGDRYLSGIIDPQKRLYCVIASYNGGAGNLFKTFNRDRRRAIDRINAMPASQVYRTILTSHPSEESRNYLKKVSAAQSRYAAGG